MAEQEQENPFQNAEDVLRHVAVHGPARNEAERSQLLEALDGKRPEDEDEDQERRDESPGAEHEQEQENEQ